MHINPSKLYAEMGADCTVCFVLFFLTINLPVSSTVAEYSIVWMHHSYQYGMIPRSILEKRKFVFPLLQLSSPSLKGFPVLRAELLQTPHFLIFTGSALSPFPKCPLSKTMGFLSPPNTLSFSSSFFLTSLTLTEESSQIHT